MTRGTPVLKDQINWRDTGCRFHPSCLTCPLPRCVYEDGAMPSERQLAKRRRIEAVKPMVLAGKTPVQVMRELGLSYQTAYDAVALALKELGAKGETR